MGVDEGLLIARLRFRPEYQSLFKRISEEDTISEFTITKALSIFMSSTRSKNYFLDQSLNEMGQSVSIDYDIIAFNDNQQLGRELYNSNCNSCHGHSISHQAQVLFTAANHGLDLEYINEGVG
jgi:cytochrome c peroxidase